MTEREMYEAARDAGLLGANVGTTKWEDAIFKLCRAVAAKVKLSVSQPEVEVRELAPLEAYLHDKALTAVLALQEVSRVAMANGDEWGIALIADVAIAKAMPISTAISGIAQTDATRLDWIKENLKDGEQYAGILLGANGAPDQHIVLLSGDAEKLTWAAAGKWAKSVGGELPTRREQSLLIAHLKGQFKPDWYWSSEQRSDNSHYAWNQDFSSGGQYYDLKVYEFRARAIRRLAIKSI